MMISLSFNTMSSVYKQYVGYGQFSGTGLYLTYTLGSCLCSCDWLLSCCHFEFVASFIFFVLVVVAVASAVED
jgi:hypothetical protein